MTEKRSFPNDWSGLSNKQVIENVKYLLEHYKEYKIKDKGENRIAIENVCLTKGRNYFDLNNKFCTSGGPLYNEASNKLNELFDKCEQEMVERYTLQQKLERRKPIYWWYTFLEYRKFLIPIMLFPFVLLFYSYSYKKYKKYEQIEKAVKQYEKTLPCYQEYQQKIACYRDSLQRASK